MQLQAYLDRIGYDGPVRPDAGVLKAIHRAHAQTIPYENLDVQFETPVTRAIEPIFDKIVTRKRGGWCFEMNGLLGWALEVIGFKVERLAGGVAREVVGDEALGNHLVLIVDLDEPWLVDAGYGDGLIEAVPLRMGAFSNGPFDCSLEDISSTHGAGWLRYHNDKRGGADSYDFNRNVTDEALLEKLCTYLQTSEESSFVQNAVVQRWVDGEHLSLRGRILQRLTKNSKEQETIETAEDYVRRLKNDFNLDLPEAAQLWPKICARHEVVFGADGIN